MLEEWTKAKLMADRDNRDTEPIPKFDLFSFLKKKRAYLCMNQVCDTKKQCYCG